MLFIVICVVLLPFGFASINTTCLPSIEVDALREIGRKLGKEWNFDEDPCVGWSTSDSNKTYNNTVSCSREINGTNCHVVTISLKGQSLPGTLPPELANLRYLQDIDLTRNFLNGTIPPEWGSMEQLSHISILGNRVTGSIPKELGNISTLKILTVEDNMMSGRIPDELGNLSSIEQLFLNSNYFTGELPGSLANLITMKMFRIGSNNFSGKIPDFIGEWTSLERLRIQGSGFEGPIPPSITMLPNLKDLRISDLRGPDALCPPFSNSTSLQILILRSCNLIGELPEARASNVLDLSFNKFNGSIPERFSYLERANNIYLTGNSFSGRVPDWIRSRNSWTNIDLSYNNFTSDSSLMSRCRTPEINLFASFSTDNISYNVSLHFAEINFTDDTKYSSLGRRVFDIYIQRKLVEKDFDISDKAGGIGKEIVKNYTVNVTTTLEIRLYWAGKGTIDIPIREMYGPLISAISVNPTNPKNDEPLRGNGKGVSGGTVAGIVVGAVCAIVLILGLLWWWGYLRLRDDTMELDMKGLELTTGSFTLRQIKSATNNFDVANKIGEGGFGSVYKGVLPNGTLIAVKQLSSKSKQGNREFLNELGMISALQHPNLVKLHGCCIEGNQLLLAYEYMENNSLARALFGPKEWQLELDWPTRYRICINIARGLAFLHEESRLKIVHRDIKATNVLLDKNLNAKISDFGLAKLDEEDNTHISTRIAGTYGYMAPEYALRGYLTDKADVYSYGIVLLEIVSGMANTVDRAKQNHFVLLDRAVALKNTGNLMDLVDPKLGSQYVSQEVMVVINLALVCTAISPTDRPTMSLAVSMLEGRIVPQTFVVEQSVSMTRIDREKMMKQLENTNESKIEEAPITYTESSTSGVDLYPLDRFSDYLQKRDIDATKLLS